MIKFTIALALALSSRPAHRLIYILLLQAGGALATDEFLAFGFGFGFGFNFSAIRLLISSKAFPLSASEEKNWDLNWVLAAILSKFELKPMDLL